MPLSKAKKAEYNKLRYLSRKDTGLGENKIPNPDIKIPNLPWYAGVHNHFGDVKNRRYAEEFFNSIGNY